LQVLVIPFLAAAVLLLLLFLYKATLVALAPALKPGTIRMLAWFNYHARIPLFLLLCFTLLPLDGNRTRRIRLPLFPPILRTLNFLQRGMLFLMALSLLLLTPFGFRDLMKAAITNGGDLYREKCSFCHSPRKALDFLKPEMGWRFTVKRMASKRPGWISREEQEVIYHYLKSLRSHSDRQLFLLKCKRCHLFQDLLQTERSPAQWDRIVDRVWWEDYLWMQKEEANQIKRHIRGRLFPVGSLSSRPAPLPEDPKRITFEIKCARCHYLDVCLEEDIQKEDWLPILIRMSEKCPDYLPAEEAVSLHDWLIREIQDPDAFYRRYPHSKPMGWKE